MLASSSIPTPITESLRAACTQALNELPNAVEPQLPGIIVMVQGRVELELRDTRSGPLGSYRSGRSVTKDRIALNVGHDTIRTTLPSNTAFSLVKTLLHELVHLYCDRTGVRDVVSRSQEHTAAYARVASRAGLEVKHLPHTTVKYYTPDLTFEARLRLQHIAAALRAAWPEMHSLRSLHAQGSIFSSSTSPNTPKGHDSHVF